MEPIEPADCMDSVSGFSWFSRSRDSLELPFNNEAWLDGETDSTSCCLGDETLRSMLAFLNCSCCCWPLALMGK